ncbi:MAG TPA: hydrogen gas-evolving membrane-bound hydrogenase subunit E [Acidimicrobiales bacterium]|nr:hydrogen gas-evolving membrane-bound hydrogenase subunit E [Acidimicrobiales bacterium]
MALLVLLHAVLAVAAPAVGRRYGKGVFAFVALAPAATFVWALARAAEVLDGGSVRETAEWVPQLGLALDFRLDAFSLVMVLLVSGVGVLVFLYCASYFGPRPDLGRFAMYLTGFAGAMLGLVLADNLLLLYVFWELTSITSYLLIGFDDQKDGSRRSALQALLITTIGGLAMLGGLVLVGQQAGTHSISEVLADPPTEGAVMAWAVVLLLMGAFTKSAQVPFHAWLPGAMAAPTPVSAYLHSATMVKAGVYLVARFSPAFADVGLWRPLTVGVGVATMLWGGWRALRQHDLKLVLAYGTISQLGFLIALFGWGSPKLLFAGTAMLLAHGIFKACLFLVVGIVDHQAHSRDLRRLHRLGTTMPVLAASAAAASMSMAGIPPLLGFVTKEAGLLGYVDAPGAGANWALAGIVVGSMLTTAYTARFWWGAFWAKPTTEPIGPDVPRPSATFVAPVVLLAVLSVVGGLWTAAPEALVGPAAGALTEAAGVYHLVLWPGWKLPLYLSLLAIAGGLVLFALRRPVEALQEAVGRSWTAETVFHAAYAGTLNGARRFIGVVQPGSLSFYLSVLLITFVISPGTTLFGNVTFPDDWVFAESPEQAVVVALVVVAAIATVVTSQRFAAVLALGAVGYGVALLFEIQGAPDLALTQFLVETVVLVLFLLVLRELPKRFRVRHDTALRLAHGAVALGVGAIVFSLAVTTLAARTTEPVGPRMTEVAYPEGQGRNVVNVILTDIRAMDTLGEIVVIAVAAIGTVSLVRAGRPRSGSRPDDEQAGSGDDDAGPLHTRNPSGVER